MTPSKDASKQEESKIEDSPKMGQIEATVNVSSTSANMTRFGKKPVKKKGKKVIVVEKSSQDAASNS